jgi:hypothetical protein
MPWRHSSKLCFVGVADDEDSSAAPGVAPAGELDEQPPTKAMVVQEASNRTVSGLKGLMGARR